MQHNRFIFAVLQLHGKCEGQRKQGRGLKFENSPSDTYMQDKCAASHSIHWLVQQSCENKAAGISRRVGSRRTHSSSMGCLLLMGHRQAPWNLILTRLSKCPHKTIPAGIAFVLSLGSRWCLKIAAALWLGWLCPKAPTRFEARRHFPMHAAGFA